MRILALVLLARCASGPPLSTALCIPKTGKTDVAAYAPMLVKSVDRDGTFAVQVVNDAPELHATGALTGALARELADRGIALRDEAECERFLRVTVKKRQIYVEVVDRKSRRVLYLHEYALAFC